MADVRKNFVEHDKALLFDLCIYTTVTDFDETASKLIVRIAKFGKARFKENI